MLIYIKVNVGHKLKMNRFCMMLTHNDGGFVLLFHKEYIVPRFHGPYFARIYT